MSSLPPSWARKISSSVTGAGRIGSARTGDHSRWSWRPSNGPKRASQQKVAPPDLGGASSIGVRSTPCTSPAGRPPADGWRATADAAVSHSVTGPPRRPAAAGPVRAACACRYANWRCRDAFEFTPRVFPDDRGLFVCPVRGGAVPQGGRPPAAARADQPQPVPARRRARPALRGRAAGPGEVRVLPAGLAARRGGRHPGRLAHVRRSGTPCSLDPVEFRAVYVPEGVAHGVMALEDDTVISYLCSTGYNPAASTASTRSTPRWACPGPTTSSRSCPTRTAPPRRSPRRRGVRAAAELRGLPGATTSGCARPVAGRGHGQIRHRIDAVHRGRAELAGVGRRRGRCRRRRTSRRPSGRTAPA